MRKYIVPLIIIIATAACTDSTTARPGLTTTTTPPERRGPALVTRPKASNRIAKPTPLPSNRIALVIGNNAYSHNIALKNPVNDAKAMAAMLRQLGFDVTELTDAKLAAMQDAVQHLQKQLARSSGGVGLFYFAGHGIRSESGLNYLLPVDYQTKTKAKLTHDAIDADSIRLSMEQSNNALNIAILDACRNDPLTRNVGQGHVFRGLAPMQAKGTIIALATAPGEVALDGDGYHGVYTKHLLLNLRTPGLDIKTMLDKVGKDVAEETTDQQRPWYHTSINGDFMFVPPEVTPPPLPATLTAAYATANTGNRDVTQVEFAMLRDTKAGQTSALHDGDTLQSNDGYFFHVRSNSHNATYLYLYQIDSAKKVFRLFPSKQYNTRDNPVPIGASLTLPNDREVYFLDNTVGQEKFYLLAAAQPLPALDRLQEGTVDDIMNSGLPLRGPAGVRAKTDKINTHWGETTAIMQELSSPEQQLLHTITIEHR